MFSVTDIISHLMLLEYILVGEQSFFSGKIGFSLSVSLNVTLNLPKPNKIKSIASKI